MNVLFNARSVTVMLGILLAPVCGCGRSTRLPPLHEAIDKGDVQQAEALIQRGENVNSVSYRGTRPLHLIEGNQASLARYLIAAGADVNAVDRDGRTSLHVALMWSSDNVVNILVAAGANLRARSLSGRTALHYAAVRPRGDGVLRDLLSQGLDANAADDHGCVPLHLAAENDDSITVSDLIDFGAQVDASDDQGRRPLHFAAGQGVSATEVLITHGATVDVGDREGHTPLHYAVYADNVLGVEALLKNGADIHAKAADGKSALDIARDRGREDIIDLMLRMSADGDLRVQCSP